MKICQKRTKRNTMRCRKVRNFNRGGQVPGSGNKDTVPAMLTPGEVCDE